MVNFMLHVCVSLSVVSSSVTPWTVARQAPLSMEFTGQNTEYCSGWPFPFQGIFPTQGLNPSLLHCRQILYYLSRLLLGMLCILYHNKNK